MKLLCRVLGHRYIPLPTTGFVTEDGLTYVCDCPWQCSRCGKVWTWIYTVEVHGPFRSMRLRLAATPAIMGPGRWE